MTAALAPTSAAPFPLVGVQAVKWPAEDFYLMSGLPSVRDRKVMLIEGEVLEVAAPSPLHDMELALTAEWLRTPFPSSRFVIRTQSGLYFGINTDPVPDLAVVPGSPRSHPQHPQTAILVVEVADSSLAFDLGDKASLYAAAGIADYWVIDVNDRRIHLFRDPQPDGNQKYGVGYKSVQILNPKDRINPLAAPSHSVDVVDLP